jgi:hypothetical protein
MVIFRERNLCRGTSISQTINPHVCCAEKSASGYAAATRAESALSSQSGYADVRAAKQDDAAKPAKSDLLALLHHQMMFQAQVLGQLAQSLGLGVGAQQAVDPVQSMPMYGGWPMPMNGGSNIPIHTTPDGMAHRQRRDTFNSGGGGGSGGSGGSGGKNASYSSNSKELEDFTRII